MTPGDTSGALRAIKIVGRSESGHTLWACECLICGMVIEVRQENFGRYSSCGARACRREAPLSDVSARKRQKRITRQLAVTYATQGTLYPAIREMGEISPEPEPPKIDERRGGITWVEPLTGSLRAETRKSFD